MRRIFIGQETVVQSLVGDSPLLQLPLEPLVPVEAQLGLADDPRDTQTEGRFSFLIPFRALSIGFLRVALVRAI